ncbi:MAG: GntR family transcriptional regulator [Butyricicoccus pullicaecorum]|nr:GntR family transcriptional regulator [Butyricicoccus pullicaecorum]
MQWKLTDDRPIWTQLTEQLTQRIVSGIYPLGARMPSVRELAAEAKVNPNTMQRALAQLEQDGLVTTNRTAGRTVTEDADSVDNVRHCLAEEKMELYVTGMATIGYTELEAAEMLRNRKRGNQ